jgi:hypothetical protein
MTILESAFEQVSDAIEAGAVKQYDYDVKVEVLVEEGVETVKGKRLLARTFDTLKNATRGDEIVEFFDTEGTPVHANLAGVKSNELGKRFCVEITKGRKKLVMFGAKIKSTIPFSTIKERTIGILNKSKTYVRVHHGGFSNGVNWINLGFLLGQHPATSNKDDIMKNIRTKIHQAWEDNVYWTANKKHEIKMILDPTSTDAAFKPYQIPLIAASAGITSKVEENSVKTTVTMIMTPRKYATATTQIMDYLLLHAKTIKDYIPFGFKQENPPAFHQILVQNTMDDRPSEYPSHLQHRRLQRKGRPRKERTHSLPAPYRSH